MLNDFVVGRTGVIDGCKFAIKIQGRFEK